MNNYDRWLEQPYQDHYRQQEENEQQLSDELNFRFLEFLDELSKCEEGQEFNELDVAIDAPLMFSRIAKAYLTHRDNTKILGEAVRDIIDKEILDVLYFTITGGEHRK